MAVKRIVVIGGGTGTFTVLQALKDIPVALTAIVSTADDGGSTGILRDELGVLPPGDLRQALVALSGDSGFLRELLTYRFEEGQLKGHSFGNLLLSALEKVTGSVDQAILEAGKILSIHGQVLPVTSDHMVLYAHTDDGSVIKGEHAIEEHLWAEKSRLQQFSLATTCTLHPLARQAIHQADLVVLAPGSFYTSLIPHFLVDGMCAALGKTRGKVVYVANLMTEKGQADSFYVQDFVELIEEYVGKPLVDYVLYNTKNPPAELLSRYKQERERLPVRLDRKRRKNMHYRVIGTNLLSSKGLALQQRHDALRHERTLIRHDTGRLSKALTALLYLKEAEHYLHA